MRVVTELYKLSAAYSMDMTVIFGENLDVYQQVLGLSSMKEVRDWLNEICLSVRKCIKVQP